MGNASQDASQMINVREVRNVSKINATTAGAFVNMITIVIEAKNVKTEFVKINALGITLVLHQTKNVSLEHVRSLVVTSFVQKDQSVSKAHVILYVVKKTLHVNPFNLFAMRITKSVFQAVGEEDVLIKVLSVLVTGHLAIASNQTTVHQLKIVQEISIVTGKDFKTMLCPP